MDNSGEKRSCFEGVASHMGDLLVGVASHDEAFLFLFIRVTDLESGDFGSSFETVLADF